MRDHVISLSLAAMAAWFIYDLALDNYPAITVSDVGTQPGDTHVLSNEPVPRNGILRVSYHVTVERACTGTGRRVIVDAGYQALPTIPFSTDTGERADGQKTYPGDSFDAVAEAPVANGASPGPATYQNQTTYYCNFWQRVFHRGIEANFPVVKFAISNDSLPAVGPSITMFKHDHHTGLAAWFRESAYSRLVSFGAGTDGH